MANPSVSESGQGSSRHQDLVFNAETCRALRQKGHDAVRLLIPTVTILLFLFSAVFQGVLSIDSIWLDAAMGVTLSVIFAIALTAEIRWFGVSFYRDIFHDMKQDFVREARAMNGDHEAIESRVPDTSGPRARPELAFGLPPEDCLMILVVLFLGVILAISASDGLMIALYLGGGIGVSGAFFAFFKHDQPNTYPPENPP